MSRFNLTKHETWINLRVKDFKVKIVKKDNKINDLQASIDSLKLKILNHDEEIIEKDKDIVQITRAL